MYISKKDRETVKNKYGGLCAYSGTPLLDDWQIDHMEPVRRNWYSSSSMFPLNHTIDNMMPVQKIINHYKHSLNLDQFRNWCLRDLHKRIAKLPKNPKTTKSIRHKQYMLSVASFFNITATQPFSGIFYFETLNGNGT